MRSERHTVPGNGGKKNGDANGFSAPGGITAAMADNPAAAPPFMAYFILLPSVIFAVAVAGQALVRPDENLDDESAMVRATSLQLTGLGSHADSDVEASDSPVGNAKKIEAIDKVMAALGELKLALQ